MEFDKVGEITLEPIEEMVPRIENLAQEIEKQFQGEI